VGLQEQFTLITRRQAHAAQPVPRDEGMVAVEVNSIPARINVAAAHGHQLVGKTEVLHHAPGQDAGFILAGVAHMVTRRHAEGVGVP